MIKHFTTSEMQLEEIIGLLEQGYHKAYHEDCGDYFMICLTDDNGNMKDEEINDRFFDFEFVNVEENQRLKDYLFKKSLKDVGELINYIGYLEDVIKDYQYLKSEMLKAANIVKDLY